MKLTVNAAAELLAVTAAQLTILDLAAVQRNGDKDSLDGYVANLMQAAARWIAPRLAIKKGVNRARTLGTAVEKAGELIAHGGDFAELSKAVKELTLLHLCACKSVAANPPDGIV